MVFLIYTIASDATAWAHWTVPESKDSKFLIKFKKVPIFKNSHRKANKELDNAETAFHKAVKEKYKDEAMVVSDWMVRFSQSVWTGNPVPRPETKYSKIAGIGFRIALLTLLKSGWEFEVE